MLRLTLAQMRRSIGRLAGAGVAVLIGSAFVAATLLAGTAMTSTLVDTIAARYADADLVMADGVGVDQLADVRAIPGVTAAAATDTTYVELANGGTSRYEALTPTRGDERLEPQTLTDGRLPTADGEIAVSVDAADGLDVAVGGAVEAHVYQPDETGNWVETTVPVTVVGVLDDPAGAYQADAGAAEVTPEQFQTWTNGDPAAWGWSEAAVLVADGADVDEVAAAITEAVPQDYATTVSTTEQAALDAAAAMTGGNDVFTAVTLAFAAVALVVAALVIANTFQVLVAQRARTLALLRCVGADKAQIGRSVVLEALILGLVSSAAGVLAGFALVQVGLSVAEGLDLDAPLPAVVQPSLAAVLVPLVVGTLVTVVASLAPARSATRVAPLAALRPAEAPALGRRAGRVRLATSALLVLGGAALLGLGLLAGSQGSVEVGLLAGIAGGGLSFVGVVLGAVFWLPHLVAGIGRLLASSGAAGRLAAANTLRNPRRTTATATALLIGVTLVSMMSVGAVSARASMLAELDAKYPVDLTVDGGQSSITPDGVEPGKEITPAALGAVRAVDGVEDVAEVATAIATAPDAGDAGWTLDLVAIAPDDAQRVVADPTGYAGIADDVALVAPDWAAAYDLADGDVLDVAGESGTVPLTVRVADVVEGYRLTAVVSPATLDALSASAPVTTLWVEIADDADPLQVQQDVITGLGDDAYVVQSPAAERAQVESTVDTMLAVVVGLLAAAVVIAVIGVANTLSLSVIERRRESATLRAIGLSRVQLRLMLSLEGVLIAVVGAVAGIGLGLLYGWAGAFTALSAMGDVQLGVPWRDFALVLVGAVLAGLLASLVPARAAVRTSPVEALAAD
ncbi:putative ABC transport system permease protein [Sediminihabitans luteus]|uniref:Putative ABC transport system permease protein n=1 Tax=Sediminihabitans luteus TaxID=1138585 RepID=A0A2M9CDL9_9CELL|nr:ABC transporter permease [Sediminihabitans luteus]PJJ69965.1 putative ABC transport system permease protein [Sediminihabitans luteus]GII99285.1 ABC transporter permease [Sediminihabitans luteus]